MLSDINNILTFKMTIEATNCLCEYFKLNKETASKILQVIDETKPIAQGYDICIEEPIKIIAEVKCISPINDGIKYGAAQWNTILDDFYKLKNGKGLLKDRTSEYYKSSF